MKVEFYVIIKGIKNMNHSYMKTNFDKWVVVEIFSLMLCHVVGGLGGVASPGTWTFCSI